jgi:hypothetical protein
MRLLLLFASFCSLHAMDGWKGVWVGTLDNLPRRPGSFSVEVRREIGELPTQAGACTVFRTEYRSKGRPDVVKDYKLCRGTTMDEWYVDEGNNVKLKSLWTGEALVSIFRVKGQLLVDTMRVGADGEMLEEIVFGEDPGAVEGVQSLNAKGVQRLRLRRKP